jgi:hypothetical protein
VYGLLLQPGNLKGKEKISVSCKHFACYDKTIPNVTTCFSF